MVMPPYETLRDERKLVRERRSSKLRSDNVVFGKPGEAGPSGPEVEFFNPKIRHELEKKDTEMMKRTGQKGAAPGGDAWVWLTSYCRIPVSGDSETERIRIEFCGQFCREGGDLQRNIQSQWNKFYLQLSTVFAVVPGFAFQLK